MSAQAQSADASPAPALRPVVRDVVEFDEYTGRFAAVNRVELHARVSGYLSSVEFVEGQIVNEGDLLFVIDQRPFDIQLRAARAELAEARANLDLARREAERARSVRQGGAVSQEELDQRVQEAAAAQARLSRAQAAVAEAELDLEFTEVRAPLAGRIGQRAVDVGNLVSGGDVRGTLLTTIVQEDPIHFYFEASEADLLRYARLSESGARPSSRSTPNAVSIRLLDEDEFQHHGVMDFVDNELDPTTGTVTGRAVLSNARGLLQPGMFGRLKLIGSGVYSAVMVPDEVVQFDQSRRFVMVVNDAGVVERRWVTLGPIIDGLRVVRDGLDGDEVVVAGAFHRIRLGTAVAPQLGDHPDLASN